METPASQKTIRRERWKLLFAVRRGVRYHRRREQFFEMCHGLGAFITALAGSAGALALFTSKLPHAVPWLVAIAAGTSVVELVFRFGARARRHTDLARDFVELERDVERRGTDVTMTDLADFRERRLEIESHEPKILNVLNVICDDEVSVAMGVSEKHLSNVRWYQRCCAQLIDIMPHTLRRRSAASPSSSAAG